jgi:hypothetical protein
VEPNHIRRQKAWYEFFPFLLIYDVIDLKWSFNSPGLLGCLVKEKRINKFVLAPWRTLINFYDYLEFLFRLSFSH